MEYNNKDLMNRGNTTSVKDVLQERGDRYGSFDKFSMLAQQLKSSFHNHVKEYGQPETHSLVMSEAMDMILHKIARIANGDATYKDNIVDIIGYAQLVLNDMEN